MSEWVPAQQLPSYDAVVLAGGRARRLGGVHKPALEVGGRPVIQRVAAAVSDAGRLIVVGPADGAPPRAVLTREEPPGSGPLPALAAGLERAAAPWVAVLAGDLPFLRHADIVALRRSARGSAGAVLVDTAGRNQWLAGVWRVSELTAGMREHGGSSLGGLLGPLEPVRLAPDVAGDEPPPWLDCDTAEDLEAARTRAAEGA